MKNYLALTKFFLSLAIAFSSVIGYLIFFQHNHHIITSSHYHIITLFLGVFFLSSAASALNQLQEKKTDRLMNRTKNRPLASFLISEKFCLFVIILNILAGSYLLFSLSAISALLGLLNILIYNFIYTPLKYKTSTALIAGGLVGSIPPLIGWYANVHTLILPQLSILYFSAFMFFWQIPHFILLNIKYNDDYSKSGLISIVNEVNENTIKFIFITWLFCAGILSLFFPLAGLVTNKLAFIFLIFVNIFIITLFFYFIFRRKVFSFKTMNFFIHFYLMIIMIIIIINH